MRGMMNKMIIQQREEHNIFLHFAMGIFSKKKSDEKEEDK